MTHSESINHFLSLIQFNFNQTELIRSDLTHLESLLTESVLNHLTEFIRSIPIEDDLISLVQISSLLTSLSLTGLDLNQKVISCFVKEIVNHWNLGKGLLDRSAPNPINSRPICDIVGTGGDGFNTFNVSTTAAIVAAGAGVKVCKHGNRASSSASGSADLLMALGIPLDRLKPDHVSSLILEEQMDFNFLYSPTFYPIFKRLAPIRKSLGFPTIFNRLGPLLNPAKPDRLIIGISNPKLGPTYCEVLRSLGLKKSWVICSDEGLDEISTAGPTSLWKLNPDGSIDHQKLEPLSTFGLPTHPIDLLTTSNPQDSLKTLNNLLNLNDQVQPDDQIAKLDFVLMNCSALLVLADQAQNFKHGVQLARESLRSGRAKAALERLKTRSLVLVNQA